MQLLPQTCPIEVPQECMVHVRKPDKGQTEDTMDFVRNVVRLEPVDDRLLTNTGPLFFGKGTETDNSETSLDVSPPVTKP